MIHESNAPIMLPLPGDDHALLRAPGMVPERLRRPISDMQMRMASHMPDRYPHEDEEAHKLRAGRAVLELNPTMMSDLTDVTILAFVISWSVKDETGEHVLPVTLDGLMQLPGRTYDALKTKCETLRETVFPSFDPTPDPETPTVLSVD